ncbi:murein biosynthesis integral membrane protein MurJ [Paraclostridium sordellii]|uniref:Probable lipid II flippase MurJ n=1 Tax=Paraclostridium sordellii TaxID=1505 RepID=A0A0C7QZU1_PARSO|nr:murein biosynthesis integral membrane protein MurJ [Paeniclostridium sordellii]QYE98686.1 murein biosynthesis integral membrane protein MurJ [Paeniclostridium sordellii]CEN79448.1 virulence factor MviN [[Clostridium] sordellii] [Paeniclostridium sordellii]CEQ02538.1 virulence factor MviN [[Clostridium] sordellii] [Paeniclostridium sordellii]
MSKVAKAAVGLMAATLIAKILGFGRELALASAYGAGGTSDAFLVAMNIPAVIFSAIGTSLGTAFIPLYCDVDAKIGKKASLKFTNNVLNIVVLMCLIVSVIGVVFTGPIVKLFAVGFEGKTLADAIYFTRVLILGMGFLGISYIMMAFLQVKGNFVIPGLMSVPYNMLIIVSIFASVAINPNILPWGTLVGLSLQFIFQYPFARKNGFRYKPTIDLKDPYLKRMIWLIGPVLIGVAVTQVNAIVDRTIASTLVAGSISALNYATKLNQFVMGMFIVSISSVIYPMLSKLSTENNKKKFKQSIVTSINVVILIIIPISVGAIILAHPIVKLLFQRGEFDARATEMTAIALIFYSVGMLGFGLRDILGKIFYSLQDTKTPMINGIIAMVLNIVLNLAFVKFTNMQLGGLAFATSISSLVTIGLLSVSLRKKIGAFGGKKIISVLIKSIISALLMALVTKFTYNLIDGILSAGFIQDAIKLGVSVGLGAIVYGVSIIIFRVNEVRLLYQMLAGKLKRK